jgi:hypothetical protein
MGYTTQEIRRRVQSVGSRIAELQASGAADHPLLAATLSDLQAEQAVWKLLLVTRRLQLQDKVINLKRWRDGFGQAAPSLAAPIFPAAVTPPPRGRTDRRGE